MTDEQTIKNQAESLWYRIFAETIMVFLKSMTFGYWFHVRIHLINPYNLVSHKKDTDKQCRPRSDAAERDVI